MGLEHSFLGERRCVCIKEGTHSCICGKGRNIKKLQHPDLHNVKRQIRIRIKVMRIRNLIESRMENLVNEKRSEERTTTEDQCRGTVTIFYCSGSDF
jgi:hypothetical protein